MIRDQVYSKNSGNVFEDLEFETAEQEPLKAELAHCVHKAIFEKDLTQSQAAALMVCQLALKIDPLMALKIDPSRL